MTATPDWINDKIEFDPSNDVQDEHIVKVFLESDDPYLSRRAVALEVGMSKEGIGNRLEQLVDIGVLDDDSVGGARIYWVRDERSDWPIPPDVEVTPVEKDVTLKSFLGRLHVQYGILGVGIVLLGALLMMAFTLFLAYEVSIPWVGITNLLVAGVLLTVVGFVLIILGLTLSAWNRFR
jgi:hypothetical protein